MSVLRGLTSALLLAAASPLLAQSAATSSALNGMWSMPRPADEKAPDAGALHRRFMSEAREPHWADAREKAIGVAVRGDTLLAGRVGEFKASCKTSICEVYLTISSKEAEADISRLYDSFAASVAGAAPDAKRPPSLFFGGKLMLGYLF